MVAPDWPYSGHMSILWAGRWGEGGPASLLFYCMALEVKLFPFYLGIPPDRKYFEESKMRNIFWSH